MSKNPGSLSEAISNLETNGQAKAQELRDHLEKDYKEVQKALESLRPLMDDIKSRAEGEVKATKGQIEEQVKSNPWVALGIVGLIAFILGWIFGSSRK